MRRILSLVFLIALTRCSCEPPCDPSLPFGAQGACADPHAPMGTPGARCGWLGCSNASLACVSGACTPCGGENQLCCGANQACSGGRVCHTRPGETSGCLGGIGHMGQPCGDLNSCSDGLICNIAARTCGASPPVGMCGGSTTFPVGLRDPVTHCGTEGFAVPADNAADAEVCAQRALRAQGSPLETVPVGTPFLSGEFCARNGTLSSHNTVAAWSNDDLSDCAQSQCIHCDIEPGDCT